MSTTRRLAAGLALAVLGCLVSPLPAVGAPLRGTSTGRPGLPCAEPLVADPVGGAAAVRELGADLPEAAANIDRSPADYRALLRSDPTLRVDECGQTFVVEPGMTSAQAAAADTAAGSAADAAAADVPVTAAASGLDASGDPFTLNSRPGSLRTIFLDFDGALISGTSWNATYHPTDLQAPGFDADGDPATFSAAERDSVRSVWLRVSEDYAPFDVNVTTQDPGQAAITRSSGVDQQYGTRALITTDSALWTAICGCGGVAYVGVFDDAGQHDYYQPALVFQRGLGGTSASAKSIAEAAAHEVGHNLGLSHDGTASVGYYAGQGAWAPIMGVGYNRPVTQWSQGEYAGANNSEDDLAVIAASGVSPVTDDHADAAAGATPLSYAGPAVDGLIGTRVDTDWFTFTVPAGAGLTTVQVTPQSVSSDLDAALTVYDGATATVGAADPPVAMSNADRATGLDATLTRPLAPGTYTAKVDGVGYGSPATTGYSDYASLGRYTIIVGSPVTPIPTPTPTPTPSTTTTMSPTAPPAQPAGSGPTASTLWTGSLREAVTTLTVRRETPSGFSARRFPMIDADHDCRSTRTEVLAGESRRGVRWTSARHCSIRSGRWFSLFDRRTLSAPAHEAVVWTVPLAEAWQSGARSWSTARRQAYANDLSDSRTLLAVTATSARSRADREPTHWLPASASRCTYVAAWVAVKLRWGLTVNAAERARLVSLAAVCSASRLTVHRV